MKSSSYTITSTTSNASNGAPLLVILPKSATEKLPTAKPQGTEKLYSTSTPSPASSLRFTQNKTGDVTLEAIPDTVSQFLDAETPLKSVGDIPTATPRTVPVLSSPVPTTLVFTTKIPNLSEMSQNGSAQVPQVMRGKKST